jgi:RNA polymerase sigma factor (TIGR02999 family)
MSSAVTQLLSSANRGDASALEKLVALLYDELRGLARQKLRGGRATLLDTTALVHECFERMRQAGSLLATDRAQFLAYASRAMRSVVVDHARRRLSQRRGGGAPHVELDDELDLVPGQDQEVLRVHEALEELSNHDRRLRQVVEMRYFGGLTEEEIAAALGVTERTVRRDWEKARLLLYAVMG